MLYFLALTSILILSIYGVRKNISYIFTLYFSSIYIYTYIGSVYFRFADQIPFEGQLVSSYSFENSGAMILSAIIFFNFGIFFSNKFNSRKINNINNIVIENINNTYIIAFTILTLFIGFMAYDFQQLMYRTSYVPVGTNDALAIAFKVLSPAAAVLCAFLRKTFIKYLFILLLCLIPFALGSRAIVLTLGMFYLGLLIQGKKINFLTQVMLIGLIVIGFFSSYYLRGFNSQGLSVNFYNTLQIFSDTTQIIEAFNYISSYSIFAMEYSIAENLSSTKSFWLSVNPLPSSFLDLSSLYIDAKINEFSPVPGMVMVYREGLLIHSIFYYIMGYYFNKIFITTKNHASYGLFISLFVGILFMNSQYMLRESVRLFYYCLIIFLIISNLKIFKRSKNN